MATFSNLKELLKTAEQYDGGFGGSYKDGFTASSDKTRLLAQFYNQWAVYLDPTPKIFAMLEKFPEFFMKQFYYFTRALETIYSNMFKLLGFFDSFSDNDTFIGKFYLWMKILGTSIGVLALILYVISAWFGSNAIGRYKDLVLGVAMASLTVSFLPQLLSTFGNVIASSGQSLLTYDTGNDTQTATSLAIQPISMNTVDLLQVIKYNFDTTKLGYDENTGYLVSSKAEVSLNNITDDNIKVTHFSDWYGSTDKDTLEAFMDKASKDKNYNNYNGVAMVLGHVLGTYEGDDKDDLVTINKVSGAHWYNLKGTFSSVYLRYKVNWLAMFAQQIILMLLLIAMSIKFVQSAFNVLAYGLFAPVIAFGSIGNYSKIKELVVTIMGTVSGFWFEIALLKLGMVVMTNIETISFTVNGTTSGFFDNLGYWEGIGSRILVYFGVYFVITSGNFAIERWLGVSTRQGAGLGVALGAIGGAAYTASKVPSMASKGIGATTTATLGSKYFNPSTGRSGRTGNGIIGKAQNALAKRSATKNATSRGVGRSQAREAMKNQNLSGNNYGDKRDQLDKAIQNATGVNMSRQSQNVTPPSLSQRDKGGLSLPSTNAQNDPSKAREMKAQQMASQRREGELTNQRANEIYDSRYTPNQQQLGGTGNSVSTSDNSASSRGSLSQREEARSSRGTLTGNPNVSPNNNIGKHQPKAKSDLKNFDK